MFKFPCWISSHFSLHGHAMFYLFAASFLPEDGRSRRRAVERARWLGTPWGFRSNWGDTRQGCLKLRVWNVWRDEGEINLKPVTSFFQTCSLLGKISWGRKCHCRGYWNWHDQRGALQWQTRYLLKNVKNLRKEMINHLGTIAKSGTKAFMEVSYRADLFRVCPFSVLLQMTFCHRGCIFWGRHVDDRLAQWQSNDICIFWNVPCILVFFSTVIHRKPLTEDTNSSDSLELMLFERSVWSGLLQPMAWLNLWNRQVTKSTKNLDELRFLPRVRKSSCGFKEQRWWTVHLGIHCGRPSNSTFDVHRHFR